MAYKIISKTKSFLTRSILFEVDGETKIISAPPQNATFDDLISKIEEQYGDKKAAEKPVSAADEKEANEPETAKPASTSRGRKKKAE